MNSSPSEQKRTIVVTGASTGIGFEVARQSAMRGARVFLVSRDPGRLEVARRQILVGAPEAELETFPTDLSSLKEVRRLAEGISRRPPVHILLNNAGAVFARRQLTPEGHERTWALNVLGPFLLTNLLKPTLTFAAPARVVNVSSAAHRSGRMHWEDLEGEQRYRAYRLYSQSKLAVLLMTYEMARRWRSSRISVNACHPGFVRSRFGQNNPGLYGRGFRILEMLFGISPKRGAETPLHLAFDPVGGSHSGGYFSHGAPVPSSRRSYRAGDALRLWELLEDQTGLRSSVSPAGDGRSPASLRLDAASMGTSG